MSRSSVAYARQLLERGASATPTTGRLHVVHSMPERERVRSLFNYLGERGNGSDTVRYDRHMGSDTNHYQRMKAAVELFSTRLLTRRLQLANNIRIISLGGGTGEIESHVVRNIILPHLRRNEEVKMTLVLVDDAPNMIATAQDKFDSLLMQANGLAKRLRFVLVTTSAEELTHDKMADMNPELLAPFDIAICSYVSAWFADRELAYKNVRELLLPRGRLFTMEEHELNFTPSTSMPEDSDFAKLIREVAQIAHIPPKELYRLLEGIGFERGWSQRPVPIDTKPEVGAKPHSLYAAVKPVDIRYVPDVIE